MIHVFHAISAQDVPIERYEFYLNYLPKALQEKNARYLQWQDKVNHLVGNILLIHAFRLYGIGKEILESLQYNSFGRPFLKSFPDFNISHSGECVVCAISSEGKLGVDIEIIKPIDFNDVRNTMTENQWKQIELSEYPIHEFYRLWTIKESVIKADGRGLSIPLSDIKLGKGNAILDNKTWFFKELKVHNEYTAHLAFEDEEEEISFQRLDSFIFD